MEVVLANPRGFCAGVKMAIESLNNALKINGPPIYAFHEIVHNKQIVENFKARGVHFVESVEHIPKGAFVIFSAHGVSPEVVAQSQAGELRSIDATCPLVAKVHQEVRRFANKGYTVILVGHAGHDEIVGTMGEAPESTVLVQTESDVEALTFPVNSNLAYATQTTLSIWDAQRIVGALKRKYPGIIGPSKDDICYASQNRQEAVKTLAKKADLVLVVGSQNSSNSLRLTEIVRGEGIPAYLIDSAGEIRPEWLTGIQTVVVTAGASAPESIVEDCIRYFREKHHARIVEAPGRKENVVFGIPAQVRI